MKKRKLKPKVKDTQTRAEKIEAALEDFVFYCYDPNMCLHELRRRAQEALDSK